MCCDFLHEFSETFLILRTFQRDIINAHRSSSKVAPSLVRFQRSLNFLNRFSKNPQKSNFMKIILVAAKSFHAEGRRDRTKVIVAFLNLANAPKNCVTVTTKAHVFAVTNPSTIEFL